MGVRRMICAVLAAVLMASALAGCTGQPERESGEDLIAAPLEENKLPITKEEITLDVWMVNNSQGYAKSYNDMLAFDEIGKRTGVRLNFIHPTGPEKEQLEMVLASGDYPDIIYSKWMSSGAKMLDDGIAVRLNDYIEKLAPNLKRVFDETPEYKRQLQLSNGDIVMFPQLVDDQKFLCYDGYFIRKDWLDRVGGSIPETIDDWHSLLLKFRDTDFNGNGEKDEIPFSVLDWQFREAFTTAFGFPRFDYFYYDKKKGRVNYPPLAENFRSYLEMMHQWYEEGLINKNFMNTNLKEMDSLAMSGRLGAFYTDNNNSMPKYMQADSNLELVAVPYPVDAEGNRYYPTNSIKSTMRGVGGMITTSCRDIPAAVRLCDYLYSQEASDLMNWGIKGQTYETGPDGGKQFTGLILDNPEGKTPYEAICSYMTNTGFIGMIQYDAARGLEANLPERVGVVKAASVSYAMDTDQSMCLLPAKLTVEEAKQVEKKEAAIMSYVSNMAGKFIIGLEPLDSFDSFLAELDKMGMQEILRVYQMAYDRQGLE